MLEPAAQAIFGKGHNQGDSSQRKTLRQNQKW